MDYIELTCTLYPGGDTSDTAEIAIALLAELGFESFEETNDAVKAYIREECYDAVALLNLAKEYPSIITSIDTKRVEQENWNHAWESNFPMVVIADRCVIYAPFHTNVPDVAYRINILPQMSFGTGHHETTSLMIELMLDMDLESKRILDMGCGTGILAIFASMKKASAVTAIDIDEWAYKNAAENCSRNNVTNVDILQGDSSLLTGKQFDLILANINRNVLMEDIPTYATCLPSGGQLQLSGFYSSDLPDIIAEAYKNGLEPVRHLTKKDWVAVLFRKV